MILSILILLFASAVGYASYCNAIMDLISPKDALSHRGYEWSKEAMEANKDRNKDGHIDNFENWFPDDKWHEHKIEMNSALGLAATILVFIGIDLALMYELKFILLCAISSIFTPVFFFLISAIFQYFYTHIKK